MADGARRSGDTGVDERMSVDKGSFHSSHNVGMFMQAMSNRHPTAPATKTSVSRTVRVLSACSDATSTSKSAAFRA